MSKIVVAVNVMIEQRNKISSVLRGLYEGEIYFLYDKKHKWSILKGDDGYTLCYYPGGRELEFYAGLHPEEWEEVDIVIYRSKEIGTKEAKESFADLYTVVQELKFGMDSILDDIISSDLPF